MTTWVDTLGNTARRVYSQTGEEGILEAIFAAIGTTNRHLVDIGAGDGTALSNTRLFLEAGWHGARFDAAYAGDVNQARITAENVGDILAKYNTPGEFDLLSLDIDGFDWYVLRALLRTYAPRVIVCEVNNAHPAEPALAIHYDPGFVFANTAYFGATVAAFRLLGEAHDYVLAHVHHFNAFLVRRELIPPDAVPVINHVIYYGWPADPRPWVTITPEDCR
jgi:hypothetical protein